MAHIETHMLRIYYSGNPWCKTPLKTGHFGAAVTESQTPWRIQRMETHPQDEPSTRLGKLGDYQGLHCWDPLGGLDSDDSQASPSSQARRDSTSIRASPFHSDC